MVYEFQPIEKKFKKKCSKCGLMKESVKGGWGHNLCNECGRLKIINEVNSLTIPANVIKKHGFKNVHLYLADHPEGILIRKATKEEMGT